MKDILYNPVFHDRRNNGRHYYFGNQVLPEIEWSTIIDIFNYCAVNNLPVKKLPNTGFVFEHHNNVKEIVELQELYSKLEPNLPCTVHIYVSFLEISATFGRHKDTSDVLFWQAIGATQWEIEDNGIHSYILKQNDMIYIPRGMYHNVKPLTPRVGISLGIDY